MPSRTTSTLIRQLITSVINLLLFYPPKRGLPSRCAFVFLYEVALSTEDEDEDDMGRKMGADVPLSVKGSCVPI